MRLLMPFNNDWQIGWQISFSGAHLPAFIVLVMCELRRYWKIW